MSGQVSRRGLITGALGLGAGLPAASLLAGCTNSTGASADDGFAAGDGSYTVIEPAKRTAAPVLVGKDLDGKSLDLASFAGKVVVLNVWGSWCPPCRHEAPELVKAADQTAGKAQFLGINTRDYDASQALAFARTFKVDYPNFYDPDGVLLLKLRAVPAKAIPTTLVLDAQGRMAARILGEATASTLVGTVNDIAAGK